MNLFRPSWFIWKRKDGYGGGGGYLHIKIFYFLSTQKKTKKTQSTKIARAQGKHWEFGINWNEAKSSDQDHGKFSLSPHYS